MMYDAALAALASCRYRFYLLEQADEQHSLRAPTPEESKALLAAVEELTRQQQKIEARVPIASGDRETYQRVSASVILERAAQWAERGRLLLAEKEIDQDKARRAIDQLELARTDFIAAAQTQLTEPRRIGWFRRRFFPPETTMPSRSRLFTHEAKSASELVPGRLPNRVQLSDDS